MKHLRNSLLRLRQRKPLLSKGSNSMLFIPNEKPAIFRIFCKTKIIQGGINTFGYVGTAAAYQTGEEWLTALLDYLKENIAFALSFFREELPSVREMEPEGTYLLWLDFSFLFTNGSGTSRHLNS